MSLSPQLRESLDRAMVDVAVSPVWHEKMDRLPPRLWEDLRVKLQGIYRRATGEEFAVLRVDQAES